MNMKGYLCIIIMLTFIPVSVSYGFIENRYVWWKSRIKILHQEKELISSRGDERVAEHIDKGIRSAEKILAVLDARREGNSLLTQSSQVWCRTDVRKYISEITPPLFSLFYVDYLVSTVTSRENISFAKDTVRKYVNALIEREYGSRNEQVLKRLLGDMNAYEWKYLSLELLAARMMSNRSALSEYARREIEQRVVGQMALRNFTCTEEELKEIVEKESLDYLESFKFSPRFGYTERALGESCCWRELYGRIKKRIENYGKIRALLLGSNIAFDLQRIGCYYKTPAAFEKQLFSGLVQQYTATVRERETLSKRDHRDTVEPLPRYNIRLAIRDIDALRRGAITSLRGSEGEEFFIALEERIAAAIELRTKEVREGLLEQRKSIAGIDTVDDNRSRDPGGDITAVLKKKYERELSLLNLYHTKSVEFVRWYSSMIEAEGDPVSLYRERIARNRAYLEFVRSLINCCEGIHHHDSPSVHKRMVLSMRRVKGLFQVIGYSLSINRKRLPSVTRAQYNVIGNIKSQFLDEMKSIQSDMHLAYRRFSAHRKEVESGSRMAEKRLINKIALYETNALMSFIGEGKALYGQMAYAKEAFTGYAMLFEELKRVVAASQQSPDLEKVFKMRSLFPLMDNFDSTRVEREYYSRVHLQRLIERDSAKLITLLRFYHKKGILSPVTPQIDEVSKMKRALSGRVAVPVSSWTMNEINFNDVDRNVAKQLADMHAKSVWRLRNDPAKETDEEEPSTYIEEAGISLLIPDGWCSSAVRDSEKERGIIRAYRSVDNSAVIYVTRVDMANRTSEEISAAWLQKMDKQPVKMRWGKNDHCEYYWTVSRDDKKRVMESYAIVGSKYAVIISGVTSRERYRFFKPKIESVIESVRVDKEDVYAKGALERSL